MGKARIDRNGHTREQKLVYENKRLKREVLSLRKELARLDLSKYENIKETVEEHEKNSGPSSTQDLLEALKREWACKKEGCAGFLEIVLFNKIDTLWYYRACNCCNNRTQSQKYDSKSVKGIIKNKNEF